MLHLQQVAQVSWGSPWGWRTPSPWDTPLAWGRWCFPTQCWMCLVKKSRSTTVSTYTCALNSLKSLKVLVKSDLPLKNQTLLVRWRTMTLLNPDALRATKPLTVDMWLLLDVEFLLFGLFSDFLEQAWPWRYVVSFLDQTETPETSAAWFNRPQFSPQR